MKRKPLINYAPKEEKIDTEWGLIRYEEWCWREFFRRKELNPKFKGRVRRKGTEVCLV